MSVSASNVKVPEDVKLLVRSFPANKLKVYKGYNAKEMRIVQQLRRADWDYSFGMCSGFFKSREKLKTILLDGTVEREDWVALKGNQALTTFANPQHTEVDIEEPYKCNQADRKGSVLQAWALTYDEGYKRRCVNGIEPTIALDKERLEAVFRAKPEFCLGGKTVEECVQIIMERSQQLRKIAEHVHAALEDPYLCAFKTQVDEPVYIGDVVSMIKFLDSLEVRKELGVDNINASKGKVVFKATNKSGKEGKKQEFQFSTAVDTTLVVYKRVGRMAFWCVKLIEQFNEEAELGELMSLEDDFQDWVHA